MKLIILAAGKGERLMPLTRNTPKPLLDLGNGLTLLEEQMRAADASGAIDEIMLVIGYLAAQVEAKLQFHRDHGLRLRTIYNPFYAVSNNLMSLWLARHEMTSDFMVTNGDNLFAPEVFAGLAAETRDSISLAIGPKTAFDADDMKVTVESGQVLRVSKHISAGEAQAESPGLALVRGPRARGLFVDHLEQLARQNGCVRQFWLEVFNHLADHGVPILAWPFEAASLWQEVDFHTDVTRLREALTVKLRAFLDETPPEREGHHAAIADRL